MVKKSLFFVLLVANIIVGTAMYCMWLIQMIDWLGGFYGFIVATFLLPAGLIYPLIHWWIEGYWPEVYLWFYLVGVLVVVAQAWVMSKV